MARAKKSRKGGPIGVAKAPKDWQSKPQRPSKPTRVKKHKGKAPGSRHNVDTKPQAAGNQKTVTDKRIGSKKPVPLVVKATSEPIQKIEKRKYATPAQELAALEANERFNYLLDQLEDGAILKDDDRKWIDAQLERHQVLCDLLGIKESDDEDQDNDPFAQLDAIRIDDFKD
ncbi:Der GTPase-activating protein YihI [Alteromonas sp. ASW11-36]|uniref:Der GTPase-activating protein YihI n=1 Tax=Alteromonas arenosi TaxID=3055817 RepID=A0ABT7STN3_9ALTE|nr:Der GTPase-activating protein YihI [Alteromonas sp. ASW11-36]MDM7859354.1 Der GTPase-activating protein YihI [Alteromonas sp. ASW11-36]